MNVPIQNDLESYLESPGPPQVKPTKTDIHQDSSVSSQITGLRNLIRLTPVQVGLKPKLNAKIRRPTQVMPSPDNTTKAPKAYIPKHLKQNLSSLSPLNSSSQNAASHLTPNSCLDKPELQEEQPTQSTT